MTPRCCWFSGPAPDDRRPRPHVFHRVETAIAAALAAPVPGSITAHLAAACAAGPGSGRAAEQEMVEDLRVALAAGYDTTSHTLAWAVWHLARHPLRRDPQALPLFLDEILRRYPAGWLGSRVAARDRTGTGISVPAGTLVLYSPYLTHTDPSLWDDPASHPAGAVYLRPPGLVLPAVRGRTAHVPRCPPGPAPPGWLRPRRPVGHQAANGQPVQEGVGVAASCTAWPTAPGSRPETAYVSPSD